MAQQPPRTGDTVDHGPRLGELVVVQEPLLGIVRRSAREQPDVGFALEVDLANEALELEEPQRQVLLALQIRIPFEGGPAQAEKRLPGVVVVNEVQLGVEDELAAQVVGAIGPSGRIGGLGRVDGEHQSVQGVQRHEGRRHSAARAQEPPAA